MYNLDEILDEVREKYYKSSVLKRPTISWSKDFITDYFGVYTFGNNHITVSKILNSEKATKEMLSAVIYHENLHQDFQEHNDAFNEKANLFPNYQTTIAQLEDFATDTRNELVYEVGYNNFLKNKKQVVYLVLEETQDYPQAFYYRDRSLLVDFNAKVEFDLLPVEDVFYVFLVKAEEVYHIVGWCTKGVLHKTQQKIKHRKLGDDDFTFQLESDFDNIFVIPVTCCDYVIGQEYLPKEIALNNCCTFDINDQEIEYELDYVESYCEGYYITGFDEKTIDYQSDFEDVSADELKKITKISYSNVWLANAIYNKQPSYENLLNKAKAKYNTWLLEFSLEDYIKANQIKDDDINVVYSIIKIAVLISKFEIAEFYLEKYKNQLPQDDKVFKNICKEISLHKKK